MKTLLLVISICCLISCSTTENKMKMFIPGVYVTEEKGLYSTLKDTLIISPISKEGNSYLIQRKVSYQRIRKGKLLPVERKQEQWMGVYNEGDKVLYEKTKGLVLSFIPERNKMMLGSSEYNKISSIKNEQK